MSGVGNWICTLLTRRWRNRNQKCAGLIPNTRGVHYEIFLWIAAVSLMFNYNIFSIREFFLHIQLYLTNLWLDKSSVCISNVKRKSFFNFIITSPSGDQLEDRAQKIHQFLQPVDMSESQDPSTSPQESNTYLRHINSYLRMMQDGINEYAMYRCVWLFMSFHLCFNLQL